MTNVTEPTEQLVAATWNLNPVREETGGGCWAITYRCRDGVIAVTIDAPGIYYCAAYRGDDWNDGGDYFDEAEVYSARAACSWISTLVVRLGGLAIHQGHIPTVPMTAERAREIVRAATRDGIASQGDGLVDEALAALDDDDAVFSERGGL